MRYYNLCEGGRALGIAFGTLLIASLLLVSTSIVASSGGGSINGSVANGPFIWSASTFPGFWYEDGISGESLSVNQNDLSASQRVINWDNLLITHSLTTLTEFPCKLPSIIL